ncbi:MAG: Rieske 2Fe-2S domain-containing protein [Chloroflexota bacterium]|nr:Rieske 2Fe-2S domain-containing protein [Chloroflexota bacterium]
MIGRLLARIVEAQSRWATPFGNFMNRLLRAVFGRMKPVKDFLNGTWLGHSLHAALTDVPMGVLTIAILFDLLNLRQAADIAITFGILAVFAASAAGFADYADTDDHPRMVATVHATLMVLANVLYGISLVLRLIADPNADRTVPIVLALAGYAILLAGAWVGGEVVYALGNMVNRHAWRFFGEPRWFRLDAADIPEGVPTKTKAGAQTVVVVRQGETIYALHETCAHAGGPLSEGRIVDNCIECPWHYSRYELASGRRRSGPATFDQPRYEVRAAEGGGWEVRRIDPGTGQNL